MKSFFGNLFYVLGAVATISACMGLAKMLGPEGHVGGGAPGMVGQGMGLFIIPFLLIWLGHTLRKQD